MVEDLHNKGYYHRNICVANIMVEKKENTIKNNNFIYNDNDNDNDNDDDDDDNDNDNDNNNFNDQKNSKTKKKNTNNNNVSTFDYIPKFVDFDSTYLKTNQTKKFLWWHLLSWTKMYC
ncbi:hypothetical protein M0812_02409 [Anaeramoeba flamelloides]|uniref:Protein kinase domain-containing protein n=1 Tax=Anaeramoeba flamelloides TaxID=1746091 RepID=A0AAV7YLM0_9EUKA|nr:hypothetical protein M0812_02409 [Anaeramoeba flamelloides]